MHPFVAVALEGHHAQAPPAAAPSAAYGDQRAQAELHLAARVAHPAALAEGRLDVALGLDRHHRLAAPLGVEVEHRTLGLVEAAARVAHRERGVGALVEAPDRGRVAAQHPLADVAALHVGEEHEGVRLGLARRDPLAHRGARRHGLAGHDVADRDRHRLAVGGLHHADALAPRQAGAEHVGHRGAAAGSGLDDPGRPVATDDAAHHHPGAHHVRAQVRGPGGRRRRSRRVGFRRLRHDGILG